MSSMLCRKWCVLCLHDGSEHELFDVFSVNDLRERVEEEYEIKIKEGDVSPKICVQCFQETLTFRKQRKSYEADKERVLKNQRQLESQLVRGGREKTTSRFASNDIDKALKCTQNDKAGKVSTPSHKESSSKKSYPLSIGTKRNDELSSGSKQNSSQKIKSKEKHNSTSGTTNAEKNTTSKQTTSGHDTSDSEKRNNGSMPKDGLATSLPNSKATLENRKRVRFSIHDDTYHDCTPPPQKKLKFSEFVAQSDASSKNQGPLKFRVNKPTNSREQSDLQQPEGPDSKKDESKNRTTISNISAPSVESAGKTVTKPTNDKKSSGLGLNQQKQSINSTPGRQPSDLPGSASKKATSLKESSNKSKSTYSGLKIKIQLGKQKTYSASSSKRSSNSNSNGTKKKTPEANTTKVSTPTNVGASAPTSIQANPTSEPIISGPTRSIPDLVPEKNQLHPVPTVMNTKSVAVPIGQIQPRPTNDPSSGENQLQTVSVANTAKVVVQIQPRLPNESGPVLVPIGQIQTSNTVKTVAVSSSFNSTPAISNTYSSATVSTLTSSVNASGPAPLTDLNQNIARGDVSAPVPVPKPTSTNSTSAETNPSGSLTLTSVSPWQPSNVSTTSCPIVTSASAMLQQRSNVTVTMTALPLTTIASPVLPLETVASSACQATTSVISVSSRQDTTTTSVAPAANTDGQSSGVGIKKRRHSTFIRVSSNLFDEPDAQFASLRNNLFVRNNEQASTSFQTRPLILNSFLTSTATASGQTSLPIRTQPNNQPVVASGGLPLTHVSSQLQPTRTNSQVEGSIPVHILYKPPTNGPQSTISNRIVAQNQNPLPRQAVMNQRMRLPAVQTAAASSSNSPTTYTVIPLSGSNLSTRAVQIRPVMPIPTQTSLANTVTNRYTVAKQSTPAGNAVSTVNNIGDAPPPVVVRTSTVATDVANRSVQNAPWNSVKCTNNPPQPRPILMCQLCAEFFLTEPLMGQHLTQVHFVEFSRTLFSTVYDESIRRLLLARARRKSIATPDDLRSER